MVRYKNRFCHDICFSGISRTSPGAKQISTRDKEIITKALLEKVGPKDNEKQRIIKQILDLFLESAADKDIERIDIEVFNDVGFNKRVYLVEVHGNFKPIHDTDMIPIPLSLVPDSVVEAFRKRLIFQKFEISKAVEGKIRPFLLKVFRDPMEMTANELAAFEIPTEAMMDHTFRNGSILGQAGRYPHVGDDVQIIQNDSSKTWVTFQGLIPGLTLKEFEEDVNKRRAAGQIQHEEYLKRLVIAERAAVKGYFEMWQILQGLMITDPSPSNVMVEGSHHDGYYSVFFDIDRLTTKPVPLLEVVYLLRKYYGLTTRWHVVLDGYLDAFCSEAGSEDRLIDELYSAINQESTQTPGFALRISKYPGVFELIERYRDHALSHYSPVASFVVGENGVVSYRYDPQTEISSNTMPSIPKKTLD